jgi:hypothetical protein
MNEEVRGKETHLGLESGRLSRRVAAKGDLMASMSSGVGLPVTSMILSSWFMVEVPGNIGFPPSNSPKMQPIDHISTPFVYFVEPKRISGALLKEMKLWGKTCGTFSCLFRLSKVFVPPSLLHFRLSYLYQRVAT